MSSRWHCARSTGYPQPMRVLGIVAVFCLSLPLVQPSTAAAQTDSGSDAEARRLFEAGRAAYEAENFDEAVRNFRRAYVFSPRYPLLYNIGQAELRAGNDAAALEAFEGFLRQAPADDARRGEVEERVRVLRAMGVTATTGTVAATPTETTTTETVTETTTETVAETETVTETESSTATTTTTTPTDAGGGGPGAGPFILIGGGAAVAVVGAILMGVGASDASAVTGAPDGAMWSDLEGRAGAANTEFGVGLALLVVGVAAAGGGVIWAVAGSGSSSDSSASLRLGPGSLSLEGTF